LAHRSRRKHHFGADVNIKTKVTAQNWPQVINKGLRAMVNRESYIASRGEEKKQENTSRA